MRHLGYLVTVVFVLQSSYPVAADDDLKVFFGNLHSHTSYSDGSGLPEEAYLHAMRAGLDFLAITEHNHPDGIKPKDRDGKPIGADHQLYNGTHPDSLIKTAARMNVDGKFVAFYGQEFSTISSGNHANVFEVGEVIDSANGHFEQLVNDWLPTHLDSANQPAIIQFNHPNRSLRETEYGHDKFGSEEDWISRMGRHARLIEILNGPGLQKQDGHDPTVFERDFKVYLNLGFHLAPTGDQDNHYKTWGTLTEARTGIISSELTRAKLLEAMRARHVYASEDKNLRAIFRVTYPSLPPGRQFWMCGDIVQTPPPENTELTITYTIKDDDEPNAEYQIEVFSDTIGGDDLPTVILDHAQSGDTPSGQHGTILGMKYTSGRQFIYFRVNQAGDENGNESRLWTAPLWFDAGPVAIAANAGTDENAFVASKRSKIYHIDPDCRDAQGISPQNRLAGHEATVGRTAHKNCPR